MELKFIQNVMKLLKETDIREFEMEEDKAKIYFKKGNGTAPATSFQPSYTEELVEVKEYAEIKSQYIGKFIYKNKEGESQIKVGQEVKEGQKLAYVDTMGIKNDVVVKSYLLFTYRLLSSYICSKPNNDFISTSNSLVSLFLL